MKYLLIASVFLFNTLLASESCEHSKWGKGDEIGNANLITNQSVLNAAKLIKTGKVYSLGLTLDSNTPAYPPRSLSLQVVQPTQQFGEKAFPNSTYNDDIFQGWFGIGSQLDGLGHIGSPDGKFYNCFDGKKIALKEEENKTLQSNFWDDSSHAQIVLKKVKFLKSWIENIEKLDENISDLEILLEFNRNNECSDEELSKQFNSTEKFLNELEFKTMLSEESDNMDAVLQITAGAGGTESCDWAQMLMRMYVMYGEKNDFKVSKLNEQDGESAGIKTVTLKFEGDYAFGWLKGEKGVRRLVRISPFDSNAKRHTSFAS